MNNYKLLLTFFISCILLNKIDAQVATSASGGNATGGGGSVSYTIGQVVYTGISGSGGNINQGVQQPYEFVAVGIKNNYHISLDLSVFPNPSSSSVSLKIEDMKLEKLSYDLFDSNGKLLLSQPISNSLTTIPMQQLPPSVYYLKVSDNISEYQSFKIIKN